MLNIKVSGEIGFLMNQNKDIKKTIEGLKSPSLGTNKEPFISRSELTELKTTVDTNMEKMLEGLRTDVNTDIQKVDEKLERLKFSNDLLQEIASNLQPDVFRMSLTLSRNNESLQKLESQTADNTKELTMIQKLDSLHSKEIQTLKKNLPLVNDAFVLLSNFGVNFDRFAESRDAKATTWVREHVKYHLKLRLGNICL